MRLRLQVSWAFGGAVALAALEIVTILSGHGVPRPSAADLLILVAWLAVPHTLVLWAGGLAGAAILAGLLRRCAAAQAYAGTVTALCLLAWLREIARLREGGATYLVLEILLAAVAAGAGALAGLAAARRAARAGRWSRAPRPARAVLAVAAAAWLLAAGYDFAALLRPGGSGAGAPHTPPAPAAGRPNVILISIDTLRADHVSSYGYAGSTTPHIDALAREGVRFTNAATTAAFTVPSHASMMTGLFPTSHGATYQHDDPTSFVIRGMSPSYPTLAEILSDQGYDTAGFVSCSLVSGYFGFARGFATFDDRFDRLQSGRALIFSHTMLFRVLQRAGVFSPLDQDAERRADELTSLARDWLAGRGAGPFFLFVHYYDPHAPYAPPPPYDRRADGTTIPQVYEGRTLLQEQYTLTEEGLADTLALYDGEIRYVDHHVGELLGALKDSGALDNAIVILTSDHGESFGEHDHWAHTRVLYEDVVRVPFILRLPGGASAGAVIDDVIAQPTDILPTVLAAAGVKPPGRVEGRDLTRLLAPLPAAPARGAPPSGDTAFAEQIRDLDSVRRYGARYDRDLTTARTLRWKYIQASSGQEELYDLQQDAGETVNLAAARTSDLDSMRRILDAWRRTLSPFGRGEGDRTIDEGTLEKLRSLGYVQ